MLSQGELTAQSRAQRTLMGRINRDIDRKVHEYQAERSMLAVTGALPLSVLAEGDSWFNYGLYSDVITYLNQALKVRILNLAWPGHTAKEMLSQQQINILRRTLGQGPNGDGSVRFDVLLFSGGGNDLVGENRLYQWLKQAPRRRSEDFIDDRALNCALDLLMLKYEALVDLVSKRSPSTSLYVHEYDYPNPNGQGVCYNGPWLEPAFRQRGVPERYRRKIMRLILERFGARLRMLNMGALRRLRIVTTQGTLKEEDWANELHPTNSGFRMIAARIADAIRADFSSAD